MKAEVKAKRGGLGSAKSGTKDGVLAIECSTCKSVALAAFDALGVVQD